MNNVQNAYAPPRYLALCLGGIIFAFQHLGRRDFLIGHSYFGEPVPIAVAVLLSLVMGYGFAMLWWLIRQTKGQIWETFRPTFGRIIGAFSLTMVVPFGVLSFLPWIWAGLFPLIVSHEPLTAIAVTLGGMLITYPLSAMIVRHTYEKRLLRFGLFCLCFWTAYAGHLLYSGMMVFRL